MITEHIFVGKSKTSERSPSICPTGVRVSACLIMIDPASLGGETESRRNAYPVACDYITTIIRIGVQCNSLHY
jgi:hypothetical protein